MLSDGNGLGKWVTRLDQLFQRGFDSGFVGFGVDRVLDFLPKSGSGFGFP